VLYSSTVNFPCQLPPRVIKIKRPVARKPQAVMDHGNPEPVYFKIAGK
jgi:hypothetical protein